MPSISFGVSIHRFHPDAVLGDGWYKEIVAERTAALEAAHNRLTKTIKGEPAKVIPHEPPDIIGCYVLVPAGGKS